MEINNEKMMNISCEVAKEMTSPFGKLLGKI